MDSGKSQLENPKTAIEPEKEQSETTRRRKKRKEYRPDFNIPGVHKLILPEPTQEYIGCVAGDTVTSEKPWMNVDKDLIQEHLASRSASEFLPLKKQIGEFPGVELLMGYIPDESKDYDEFYICVTEDATKAVNEIVEKIKHLQEERLKNAVTKKVKEWRSLGSAREVEETMIKYNRSLIEVEIESKYPILPWKIHFKLTQAQDLRDGYMELRPSEDSLTTIFRKRIDAHVQVAPSVVSNEAQTVCTYPKNSFTQYEYEVPQVSVEESVYDFMEQNMASFSDILKVNGCIDLYSNDYENLVLSDKYAVKVKLPQRKDYSCFIDMKLSEGKMISSANWHPMWSGCLLCSYVDMAPSLYVTSKWNADEVYNAVHDTNPVLFWSLTDNLKPKLVLETPRPVYQLAWCPYDPNLVVGGCVNGQIVLWDITNKLSNVEEEEVLNMNQQKYRELMFSRMNWMKNIFDLTRVRPTALSNLRYSHRSCVNGIAWMSPFHTVDKTGNFQEIEEESPHSLQLMTSSEDGTLMIWDLLRKPVRIQGSFQGFRKIKRLEKKPSALVLMESPFKVLHLRLTPVYKINLVNPSTRKLSPISACNMAFFKTLYEPATNESLKNIKITERLMFNPVLQPQNSNTRKTFYAGTMLGDFIQATWEGQEFDSGEVVNFEDAQFVHFGRYHDGPVVIAHYSPVNDTILTVGGRVFALWREDLKNRPILWRKCDNVYTSGGWFQSEQATIRLVRMDGYIEIWTLFYESKSPLSVILLSNGPINICSPHARKIKANLVAMCDYRGSVRLYKFPHVSPLILKAKEEYMSFFLTREIERKKKFLTWQEEWNKRYASKITLLEEEEHVTTENFHARRRKKKEEKKTVVKESPGRKYLQLVEEQRRKTDRERIRDIILMKKQLNTDDLLKKREPLRRLEAENDAKRQRQKHKLRESGKIFNDQVTMLFPDIVKAKVAPPVDPYEDHYNEDRKMNGFNRYHTMESKAQEFVKENPFSYEFHWKNVLREGRQRRQKLDDSAGKFGHKARYMAVKEKKLGREVEAVESSELGSFSKSSGV